MKTSGTPGKVTVGTQTCDEDNPTRMSGESCSNNGGMKASHNSSCAADALTVNTNGSDDGSIAVSSSITTSVSPSSSASDNKDPLAFNSALMTFDTHCYECKVRYRDPKPKDLVMYLHALSYKV